MVDEKVEEKIEEKNEFDNLDEEVPEQKLSDVPKETEQDSMISSGSAGTVYDWSKAPTGIKAPPRVDIDGKTVSINRAEIILPSQDRPWDKTKAGDKEFKYCTFVLHYDYEGQQEFHSGVRVFNREGKYSHPTMTRDRKNQASRLMGLYADFRKKDMNEVTLKEFMSFLNGKPKAVIKSETVLNPTTNETIKKNFVGKFVE